MIETLVMISLGCWVMALGMAMAWLMPDFRRMCRAPLSIGRRLVSGPHLSLLA